MKQRLRNIFNEYFSVLSKVVIILVIFVAVTLTVVLGLRKSIVVNIDGKEQTLVSYQTELSEILERNNIKVGKKDKLSVDINSEIKNGDVIYLNRAVDVTVKVDGETLEFKTAEKNIEDFIAAENIELNPMDKVKPGLKTSIEKDLEITIRRAMDVTLIVDGQVIQIKTAAENVEELLKENSITLNELDRISPELAATVNPGAEIRVIRVVKSNVAERQEIVHATEYIEDSNLESGKSEVRQQGVSGEKEVVYEIILEDGVEVSKTQISETVITEPIAHIVARGTKKVAQIPATPVNYTTGDPQNFSYSQVLSCKATAYGPTGANTKTGTVPRRLSPSEFSTISVDPSIIPLGTRVYVENYGFAIAEDTGGAIKGNRIDVFLNSESECFAWGVRTVKVYILN